MRVILAPIFLTLILPACSLFDDTDPREGLEADTACIQRVTGLIDELPADGSGTFVPTYTYDITKLDLEAIQELSVSRSDETEGARLNRTTNETSTAVDEFMRQSVDENGAFFLGRDPALYRVRGAPNSAENIIAAGCGRQQENMRLIDVSVTATSTQPTEPDPENETQN